MVVTPLPWLSLDLRVHPPTQHDCTKKTQKQKQAYGAIKGLLREADAYVVDWLQYQSLWDMGAGAAQQRLGDDLEVSIFLVLSSCGF